MTTASASECYIAVRALRSARTSLSSAETQHQENIIKAEIARAEHFDARRNETDGADAIVIEISSMESVGSKDQERLEEAQKLLNDVSVEGERLHNEIFDPSASSLHKIRDAREEMLDKLLRLAEPD